MVPIMLFILILIGSTMSLDSESDSLTLNDMKLTKDQQGTTKLRNAYIKTDKWTNGVVPYVYHSAIDTQRKNMIERAIQLYKTSTCLKWVPRTNEQYYVQFMDGGDGQCYSNVGMIKESPQDISIGKGCANVLGTIVHEMMHAMGFLHEHMRPDRDQYIKVETSNIIPEYLSQFTKVSASDANQQSLGYDYGSVMHYPSTAFSLDRKSRTIVTIDPNSQSLIGQRNGFSKCDLEKLNKWYGCSNFKNDSACAMNTVGPVVTSGPVTSTCTDKLPTFCKSGDSNNCLSYPGIYLSNCRNLCGNCDGSKCLDTNVDVFQSYCRAARKNRCNEVERLLCPKTCGTC